MPILFPPEDYSRRNGFAGNVLDRRAETRDSASLAAALSDPAARIILMNELDVLFDTATGSVGFTAARAATLQVENLILLGWDEAEQPWLAGTLTADAMVTSGAEIIALRPLATDPRLHEAEVGAAAQARSLLGWHQSHRFCSRCGAESQMALAGYRRDCPSCGAQHFPRTDPVVIMLIADGDRVLMGRQARFAPGSYSCLAGFMEPGETLENAVRREVWEEAGIRVGAVAYHSSQPWPFPSSLMIGCFGRAETSEIHFDATELEDCLWVSRAELEQMVRQEHPAGRFVPNSSAIARKLIEHWLAEG